MLTDPPLIKSDRTPSEIVGPDGIDFLVRHIEKWNEGKQGDLSDRDRSNAARMLETLRGYGYYPGRVENKRIKWRIATKSKTQQEMESGLAELKELTFDELRDIATKGVKEIGT